MMLMTITTFPVKFTIKVYTNVLLNCKISCLSQYFSVILLVQFSNFVIPDNPRKLDLQSGAQDKIKKKTKQIIRVSVGP